MYSDHDTSLVKLKAIVSGRLEFKDGSGLPHSEIAGSKVAHTSPALIAACHVLHRLCMPRHPPIALTSRLRVHTTNGNADAPSQAMRMIISACYLQPRRRSTRVDQRRGRGIDLKTHSQCQIVRRKSPTPPKRDIVLFIPGKSGGACRDRTDDLKLAKLALSQLS